MNKIIKKNIIFYYILTKKTGARNQKFHALKNLIDNNLKNKIANAASVQIEVTFDTYVELVIDFCFLKEYDDSYYFANIDGGVGYTYSSEGSQIFELGDLLLKEIPEDHLILKWIEDHLSYLREKQMDIDCKQ